MRVDQMISVESTARRSLARGGGEGSVRAGARSGIGDTTVAIAGAAAITSGDTPAADNVADGDS